MTNLSQKTKENSKNLLDTIKANWQKIAGVVLASVLSVLANTEQVKAQEQGNVQPTPAKAEQLQPATTEQMQANSQTLTINGIQIKDAITIKELKNIENYLLRVQTEVNNGNLKEAQDWLELVNQKITLLVKDGKIDQNLADSLISKDLLSKINTNLETNLKENTIIKQESTNPNPKTETIQPVKDTPAAKPIPKPTQKTETIQPTSKNLSLSNKPEPIKQTTDSKTALEIIADYQRRQQQALATGDSKTAQAWQKTIKERVEALLKNKQITETEANQLLAKNTISNQSEVELLNREIKESKIRLNLELGAPIASDLAKNARIIGDLGSYNFNKITKDIKLVQIFDGKKILIAAQIIDPTGKSGGIYSITNVPALFNNGSLTLKVRIGESTENEAVVFNAQELTIFNNGASVNLADLATKKAQQTNPDGKIAQIKLVPTFSQQDIAFASQKEFGNNAVIAANWLLQNYGKIIEIIPTVRGARIKDPKLIDRVHNMGYLGGDAIVSYFAEELIIQAQNDPQRAKQILAAIQLVSKGIHQIKKETGEKSNQFALARNLVATRAILNASNFEFSDFNTPEGREKIATQFARTDKNTILSSQNPSNKLVGEFPSYLGVSGNQNLPIPDEFGNLRNPNGKKTLPEQIEAANQELKNRGIKEQWIVEGQKVYLVDEKGTKIGEISVTTFESFNFNPIALIPFVNQVTSIVNTLGGLTGQGNIINLEPIFSNTNQTDLIAGKYSDIELITIIINKNGGLRKILEQTQNYGLIPSLFQDLIQINSTAAILSGGRINPLANILRLNIGNLSVGGSFSGSSYEVLAKSDLLTQEQIQAMSYAQDVLINKNEQINRLAKEGKTLDQILRVVVIDKNGKPVSTEMLKNVAELIRVIAKTDTSLTTRTQALPVLLQAVSRAQELTSLQENSVISSSQDFVNKAEQVVKNLQNTIQGAKTPIQAARLELQKRGVKPAVINDFVKLISSLPSNLKTEVIQNGISITPIDLKKEGFSLDNQGRAIFAQIFANPNGGLKVGTGVQEGGNFWKVKIGNNVLYFNPICINLVVPIAPSQLGIQAEANLCIAVPVDANQRFATISPVNMALSTLIGDDNPQARQLYTNIMKAIENSDGNILNSVTARINQTNSLNSAGFGNFNVASGSITTGFASFSSNSDSYVNLGSSKITLTPEECQDRLDKLTQAVRLQSSQRSNLSINFTNFTPNPKPAPTPPEPPTPPRRLRVEAPTQTPGTPAVNTPPTNPNIPRPTQQPGVNGSIISTPIPGATTPGVGVTPTPNNNPILTPQPTPISAPTPPVVAPNPGLIPQGNPGNQGNPAEPPIITIPQAPFIPPPPANTPQNPAPITPVFVTPVTPTPVPPITPPPIITNPNFNIPSNSVSPIPVIPQAPVNTPPPANIPNQP